MRFAILVFVGALACAQPSDADLVFGAAAGEIEPGSPPESVGSVIEQIRDGGLGDAWVREGHFWILDQARCGPIVLETGTCFGANAISPYVFFDFPEDPHDENTFPRYQLGQDEAVLYVGPTPPASRYYSFDHYLYLRAMPDREHWLTFGSLAPSLNLLEIATASHPLGPGQIRSLDDAPFDDFTVVLFTANQTTAQRLSDRLTPLLEDAGYGTPVINVHPMSYADEADLAALVASGQVPEDESFSLTMGYGDHTDAYTVVLRVAAPADPAHPFLSSDDPGAAVFKVALPEPPTYDPFPWPELPPPDGTDEREPELLRTAQEMLLQAIEEQLVPERFVTKRFPFPKREQKTSGGCINQKVRCAGNSDDARYHVGRKRFRIPALDTFGSVFVVGVNHTVVGEHFPEAARVAYTAVSLNNFDRSFGVASVLDDDLQGSVPYWFRRRDLPPRFPLDAENVDSLYVVQFARDCSRFRWEKRYGEPNPYCIEFDDTILGVCPNQRFTLTERVYLNQSTATAPSRESVMAPVAIAVGAEVVKVDDSWRLGPEPDPAPTLGDWCRR